MNQFDPVLEKNISALITNQQQIQKQVSQFQKERLYQRIHTEWLQRKLPVRDFPAAALVTITLLIVTGFFFGMVWLWQQNITPQSLSLLLLGAGVPNLIMVPLAAIYIIQNRRKQNESMD